MKKLNVLSLCDGMSCCHIALDKIGVGVETYFASEIKDIAIQVTKDNYPNTIEVGDVTKISYKDGVLYTENGSYKTDIDLVTFGSPCQTFSIACKTDRRIGLNDEKKSGLFYECYRILKEINPTYFLMENVASMKDDDKDYITKLMGVESIKIDAKLISPALRKRYYWTNIPIENPLQPINIKLNDILSDGWSDRNKARCLAVIDSRPNTTPIKMFHRYYSIGFTTLVFKSEQHYNDCVNEYNRLYGGKRKAKAIELDNYKGNIFDGVRYMNQCELEKCHCIPSGYTKCLTRNEAANVIGDGWNIDVIAYILKGIK